MYHQSFMLKLDVRFEANQQRQKIARSHWYLLTEAEQPLNLWCSLLSLCPPIIHCEGRRGAQFRADLSHPKGFASILAIYSGRRIVTKKSITHLCTWEKNHLCCKGNTWSDFLTRKKRNSTLTRPVPGDMTTPGSLSTWASKANWINFMPTSCSGV